MLGLIRNPEIFEIFTIKSSGMIRQAIIIYTNSIEDNHEKRLKKRNLIKTTHKTFKRNKKNVGNKYIQKRFFLYIRLRIWYLLIKNAIKIH